MTDPHIRQALLEHISSGEPRLSLTVDGIVRAGRRSLNRRRLASGAGAIALVAIVATAASVLPGLRWPSGSNRAGNPPNQAICNLREIPRATIATAPGGPPAATGGPQHLADQMTCYLLEAVPAALPGATFSNLRRAPYLVAVPDQDGFSASAVVTTAAGKGSLIFAVGQVAPPSPKERAGACSKATCRTGPHGEFVEVFDFGADSAGVHGRTIYLYSGNTWILAGAHNVSEEVDGAAPTMPDPPLTVDQLIAVASGPQLVLFP